MAKKKRPLIWSGVDLYKMPHDEIPMLWEVGIPKVGLAILTGSSDTGKSAILRELAIKVAMQETSYLGFKINCNGGNAVYISTEDDEIAVSVAIKKQVGNLSDPSKLSKLNFICETDKLMTVLKKHLKDNPTALVVIDAITDLYPGNLNQSNEVRRFLHEYRELAIEYNCAILILHHTGKEAERRPPHKRNILGSQAFESKARALFELRKDPHDSKLRHLCLLKGNYAASDQKEMSYVLKFDEKTLRFTNTGKRRKFSLLVERRTNANEEKKERAYDLFLEGKTQTEIIATLKKEGHGITSSSTMSDWYRKWKSDSDESDGDAKTEES